MYFWNTGALASELQKETVTESEQVKYLVATILLYEILPFLTSWIPNTVDIWSFLDGAVSVSIMVIGALVCAKANRQGDNKNFLTRFICLSWPLGIRFVVLMLPTYLVVEIILRMLGLQVAHGDKYQTEWYDVAISALYSGLVFWRLRRWIRVVSGQSATV